jgi:hypothetical protein
VRPVGAARHTHKIRAPWFSRAGRSRTTVGRRPHPGRNGAAAVTIAIAGLTARGVAPAAADVAAPSPVVSIAARLAGTDRRAAERGGPADSSGTLAGQLVDAETGQPVPYGTVVLLETDHALFADANGYFRVAHLAPHAYRIRTRQIGFALADTTVHVESAPTITTVTLRMRRIPAGLALVRIRSKRSKECVATGVPDSASDPELAALFAQVRENVDRNRVLVDQYPFRYQRESRRIVRLDPGGDSLEAVDTTLYLSRARHPYQVGGTIYTDASLGRVYMFLPTFRELADSAFLAAHCFDYGGMRRDEASGDQLVRIDFRPARTITSPDVEGSIYLDANRFVVRRAVFTMTRPKSADPPLLGLTVETTFRELVPFVPMIDSVHSEQPLPDRPARSGHLGLDPASMAPGGLTGMSDTPQPVRRTAIATDDVVSVTFDRETPGGATEASRPGPQPADR